MRRRSLGRAAQDSEENGAGPWGERPPVLFPSTVWRRSPNSPVQVSQLSGAGPIFPIGPAPLESTEATFAVQAPSIKTDLRQGAIGPAPAMRDLRHTGGPQQRGSLLLRQKIGAGRKQWRDLRHAGGPQQRRHCTKDCITEGRSRGATAQRTAERRATAQRVAAPAPEDRGRTKAMEGPAPCGSAAALRASGLGAYTGAEGSGGPQHTGAEGSGEPQHIGTEASGLGRSTQERRAAEGRSTQERRPAAWARTQGRRAATQRATEAAKGR